MRAWLRSAKEYPALEQVATELESSGFSAGDLSFIQVPHHGSHHNVGPTILDRLLGPKGRPSMDKAAIISAPPHNPECRHPAKSVSNAFGRRGCRVSATQGQTLCYSTGVPHGWKDADLLPLYDLVEDFGEDT